MFDLPPQEPVIVVTASLADDRIEPSIASVSTVDQGRLERLGTPLILDQLRLLPSVSVAESGPDGSLTQIRIRGAEANHTLLFIDGIRANDPAAGNEARFELLSADLADRVDVIRGPQSALWGSEAIGGVVSVSSSHDTGADLLGEVGSHASWRASAHGGIATAANGLAFAVAGQGSGGIDSFDGTGDRDGYRNISARISGHSRLSDHLEIGGSAFAIRGLSQFDGFDPSTFLRADTGDESRYRLSAARIFGQLGDRQGTYALLSTSLLGSSNRNSLDGQPVNRTWAQRRTVSLQTGATIRPNHRLVALGESERETFHARDAAFGGFTDQDRSRSRQSLTLEYVGHWAERVKIDLAVRRDLFSRFKDATTVRAGALVDMGGGFEVAANYGEGIAQPTFFDLYGFFPGSFVGNPSLTAESSRGGEISVRYSGKRFGAAVTAYRQRLRDEIIDTFDPDTFLSSTANAVGVSKRQGLEIEAAYRPSDRFRLTATYSLLDATEPRGPSAMQIREQRRPRHSGSVALDGNAGRLTYGASIAYTGARFDTDFDLFPAQRVRLDHYWLAGGRLAYRIVAPLELTLRVANAFDSHYRDVVGYRTEGRSIHAGLRVALGR